MNVIISWTFLLLVLQSQGLKVSLEKKTTPLPYVRKTCGILQCVESSPKGTNRTQTPHGSDLSDTPASISSLSVFKLEATSTSVDSDNQRRILLGSITPQEPRLTRVSNGIKVDGNLGAREATLRLEMTKEVDCKAEFLCESRGVDSEGKDFVKTSHILQQAEGNSGPGKDLNWAPTPTMFVVSLIQQLNAKLAVLGSALDGWEDELGQLKDTLSQDIQSVRMDLDTKVDRIEDKINALGKDVDVHTDRLEDKIEFLHNDFNKDAGLCSDRTKLDGTSISGRHDQLELVSVSANISIMKDELVKLGTHINASFMNINQQSRAWQNKIQQCFNSVTNASKVATSDEKQQLSDAVIGGLDSIKSSINKKFDELLLNINATALETRSALDAELSKGNVSIGGELKSVMTELLKPKNCYKGMASDPSLVSSQYSIINPSRENNLAEPVLCDTFTDGGGWIVFQRRFSGNVNFYRTWENYKQGFGSLGGEFWLGNDNIHAITNSGVYELRVDLRYNGRAVFAHYDSFSVGGEKDNYVLSIAHYSGNAGDSLINVHNGMPFTTYDRDNDSMPSNCAVTYVGAWWYRHCHDANLNGHWKARSGRGLMWRPLTGDKGVTYSEMKIRRVF